jgi:3-oxoacyl-(acyl-carrier-protein) synthase
MGKTVVVTGIGLVTPLSPFGTIGDFWIALCSGTDAVRRMPSPLLDTGREWLMAEIDVPDYVRPEEKYFYLADHAMRMTVSDAKLENRHAGLSVGTVLGNILSKQRRLMNAGNGPKRELESLSYLVPYLAAKHEFGGPQLTISTACASGTDAIGVAARKVMSGKTDVMIAGGVDVLSDFALTGFHSLQALTETKVRPFDKNRSGLALGEGAAFIVLESEEHAMQRGANVYGKVLGYSSRLDAHHLTAPHREGRGLAAAIKQALLQAGLGPAGIGYINAHGTGTVYNDLMETVVIKKVFGDYAYGIPVSSTKSMVGHSFGAAGAVETICCLLSIKNKMIPPTINYEERDPECDLDYVPNKSRQRDVRVAMSLSAGFGGQNSAIIVGEAC